MSGDTDRAVEALKRAIEWAETAGPKATVFGPGDVSYSPQPVTLERAIADAILSVIVEATDTALDVERLAEAEWITDQGNWFLEKSEALDWAKEVAATYERLSRTPDQEPG